MKKLIFIAIFSAIIAFPALSVVQAQTVSDPATQEQVQALEATIRSLLLQLIADLQAQITTLIAQQAVQQTQIQTIVQNTTPVLGASSTPSTPVIVVSPKLLGANVSLDTSFIVIANNIKALAEGKTPETTEMRTFITVLSSKPLNLTKTLVTVDGSVQSVSLAEISSTTQQNDGSYKVSFYIDPGIYSGLMYDVSNPKPMSNTVQLSFYTTDDELLSTRPWTCTAYPTTSSGSIYLQPDLRYGCNGGTFSVINL